MAALDAGPDEYFVKPLPARELLSLLRAAFRRGSNNKTLTTLNLKIDFDRHCVTVYGKKVTLTLTEFELLKHLVSNEGKLMSHARLKHLMWGPEHTHGRDALRVFISTLRKKIEPDSRDPQYIHTENRVGYLFEAINKDHK